MTTHQEALDVWGESCRCLFEHRVEQGKLELAYEIACFTLTLAEQEKYESELGPRAVPTSSD